MIRLRPSGADEVLIKRVRDWYEPGPGVFIAPQALFSPGAIFTTGVNGAWYDPSDFSTMFQDAAGTTPVTAVGQPVGRILDKSGRSNHAFNPSGNSANFPVLSARYNLLTKTEQFDDAVWTKGNATVSANAVVAPDGTLTGDAVIPNNSNAFHEVSRSFSSSGAASLSVFVKTAGYSYCYLNFGGLVNGTVGFNLVTPSVFSKGAGVATATIVDSGGGWFLVSATVNAVFTTFQIGVLPSATIAAYTGDGTSGIYVWGADLRVSNDALNQPTYQRVNTSTDYDAVGFKPYLSFNGVNQWLQTNSIDFTYGDKMFVSAGVRKLSDAATGMLIETSTSSLAGSFSIRSPQGAAARYSFVSTGSAAGQADSPLTYPAPITNVLAGIGNISGGQAILRVNGAQAAINTADQGTGNYGNYPLYIGARAGTSLWFNGRLYGLVVAGKQASASEIASTEAWLNQKTGAY